MAGMAPGGVRSEWVNAASVALWQMPTPRLRYVIVTVRVFAERTDVGARFIVDDRVTAVDRDLASDFEGELISDFPPGRGGVLDLSPVALPSDLVPAIGPDEFVLYARAGEVDPRGAGWAWGPLSDPDRPRRGRFSAAVTLALRGCVPPGLCRVLLGFSHERARMRLSWERDPGIEAVTLERILTGRVVDLVPELGMVDVNSAIHDPAEEKRLVQSSRWFNAFIAGPAPWLDSIDVD